MLLVVNIYIYIYIYIYTHSVRNSWIMIIEMKLNDNDEVKRRNSKKSLSECNFVHWSPQNDWYSIQPVHLW